MSFNESVTRLFPVKQSSTEKKSRTNYLRHVVRGSYWITSKDGTVYEAPTIHATFELIEAKNGRNSPDFESFSVHIAMYTLSEVNRLIVIGHLTELGWP